MKKSRHGKYKNYEKRILQFLIKQEDVTATKIMNSVKIQKSSCYDVLGQLRYFECINWIGEPQDAISMIWVTPKGRKYLKHITDGNDLHQSELSNF